MMMTSDTRRSIAKERKKEAQPTIPPPIPPPPPPPRRLARAPSLPQRKAHHHTLSLTLTLMTPVSLVRDRDKKDEARSDETESVSSQEESAEMVGELRAPGVGVDVEFVVPEAEGGDGGGGGNVRGNCGADVHGFGQRE